MTKAGAPLANCYAPALLSTKINSSENQSPASDNRKPNELRPVRISAMNDHVRVQMGLTDVVARSTATGSEKITLKVRYLLTGDDARHETVTKENNLAQRLQAAVEHALANKQVPVTIEVCIWYDDGDVWTAALTAISASFGGIEVWDLVTAASVALLPDGSMVINPAQSSGGSCMRLAMMGKMVVAWEQEGAFEREEAESALALCKTGCRTMRKLLQEYLIQRETGDSSQ